MDQGGQAGGEDDPPLLSPFSLEPSAVGVEPAGLQLGEFVAAAGVTKANRELVADESAAAAGEDRRTAGQTCALLLAIVGGRPSEPAAVWEYGAADRGAVASGGIAEAVAGKSIQSQEGTEGCLTGPDGKAVVSSFGTRVGAHGTLCLAPGPAKENNDALESLKGYRVGGGRELKRKFRIKGSKTQVDRRLAVAIKQCRAAQAIQRNSRAGGMNVHAISSLCRTQEHSHCDDRRRRPFSWRCACCIRLRSLSGYRC